MIVPDDTLKVSLGATLSVDDQTFTAVGDPVASPDLSYQWKRGRHAIRGATGSTYTITSKDLGKRIRVKVTAGTPGALNYIHTSAKTQEVHKYPIAGTLGVDVTSDGGDPEHLTATPTGITELGVKYHYQWYRNGHALDGKTKSTYRIRSKDAGKDITVRVRVTKHSYTREVVVSAPAVFGG